MFNTQEIFNHDRELCRQSGIIGGCDEAGRGPLAGPVVCAAVIMPLDDMIDGIYDSKSLNAKEKDRLFDIIMQKAVAFSVVAVSHETIDKINILNATKEGMVLAINGLKTKPDLLLVDAVKGLEVSVKTLPIIKGDQKSYNIAAASILAKVTRDRIMQDYDTQFSGYNFSKHKGYPTKAHYEAISSLGVCPIHRRSFLKNVLGKEAKDE